MEPTRRASGSQPAARLVSEIKGLSDRSRSITQQPQAEEPARAPNIEIALRREEARAIRDMAEQGLPILSSLAIIRAGLRKAGDSIMRGYLAEAAALSLKSGRYADTLLPVVSLCLDDPDMRIRHQSVLSFAYCAENKADTAEFLNLDLMAKRLDDISPNIREAAIRFFIAYSSEGPDKARAALDALSGVMRNDVSAAVRDHCMGILEDSRIKDLSDHLIPLLSSLAGPSLEANLAALEELEGFVRQMPDNARLVLRLMHDHGAADPLSEDLKKTCYLLLLGLPADGAFAPPPREPDL